MATTPGTRDSRSAVQEAPLPRRLLLDASLVFAVGLAARIVAVTTVRPDPSRRFMFDPTLYYLLGYDLAHLKGYTIQGFQTAAVPPSYPAVLAVAFALFGSGVHTAVGLNAVLGAVTCALTYLLGRELFGRAVGIAAAALLALLPNAALFASVLMAENLAAPLLMLALYVAVVEMRQRAVPRMPVVLALGALVAAGFLARGEMITFVAALPAALFIAGSPLRTMLRWTLPVVLICGLAAGSWITRNELTMGTPVIATTTVGNGLYSSLGPYFQGFAPPNIRFANPALPRDQFEVEASQEQMRQALHYAREHPAEELRRIPIRFWRLVRNDEGALRWITIDPQALSSAQRSRLATLCNVAYAPIILLAALGVAFRMRRRDARHMLLACVIAGWVGMHTFLFGGEAHYHFVLLPLMTLFAAAGAQAIYGRVRRERGRRTGPAPAATR